MSVAVLPVYNRPKSVERSDRLQVDHDDARWAHDHYREESSPTRSRNLYELMKNNPKCSYFSHEHDDRWKASSSRSHLSPAKDRNFHNIVRKDRKSTRSNNIVSQQRFSFGKEDGPVVPIKSSFPGRMTTGYHFQHDNTEGSKRSMSPIEPGQMLGSHIDSPPRGMPDHLRWLHSRWKKYDKTTFEKNFGSRAAAVFEQMQKGDKSRWKNVTGTSAFTTITKGSWEEDYLKELEETDPFLDDFSPEKLKKLKMESRVKEETEKAKRRAGEKIVRGFLEKKGFLDDSHSHRSSRHSVTPEKERADRLAGGRYGRPYHEFWKRSATDTSRMMTFKEFLMSLPDDSEESDEISAKRYAEYKKVFCSEAHKEFFEVRNFSGYTIYIFIYVYTWMLCRLTAMRNGFFKNIIQSIKRRKLCKGVMTFVKDLMFSSNYWLKAG